MHPDRRLIAESDPRLEFTGTLVQHGRACAKTLDGVGTVPVLILELESDSGMHMPLHVEQTFPVGHMPQAEAAARRYRRGQRVTVQAPALSARLAVVAAHIHTHKDNETEQCATSPSSP